MRSSWPQMQLRGGIGEFRQFTEPTLLSGASMYTGLVNGVAQLRCIGDATPSPVWRDYLTDQTTIPQSCVNGQQPVLSDASPNVLLFDPSFHPRRSWRGNLAWRQLIGEIGVSVEGIYSLNLDQPSRVDLNFADSPRFSLADEAGRPVFVSATSIVPSTGLVSAMEARRTAALGRVLNYQSDLRSSSRQLSITGVTRVRRSSFSLSYTLLGVTERLRGFDGTTFGSPSEVERAIGSNAMRHQLQSQVAVPLPFGMNLSVFTRISSGVPYTPRIAGDVNGDGLSNDRAFVFNPQDPTLDPSVAAALNTLLRDAPSEAQACLRKQLGRAARPNSCHGPWSADMAARINLFSRSGMTRRSMSAALYIANPLGGLDQLLHGSKDLHGWGSPKLPDPTLLTVRGFDSVNQRFRYEVNPRFGNVAAVNQLYRSPFRITLDVMIDLGHPVLKQHAMRLLQPGRRGTPGQRLSSDSTAKVLRRQVPDLYDRILRESDSLLISRPQAEALRSAQAPYRSRMDSLWKVTGETLAKEGDDYDANQAMHAIDDAIAQAWLLGRDQLPVLERILTPVQLELAPFVPLLRASIGKKRVEGIVVTF